MVELLYKELSYQRQGAFFGVYKSFSNAFKESVYHNALIGKRLEFISQT